MANKKKKSHKVVVLEPQNLNTSLDFAAQVKKLHREQVQQLQESFLALEDSCKTEIRTALKEDLSSDLKLFLNKVISQAVHEEFGRQLPPLVEKLQEDLAALSSTLEQTHFTLLEYKEKFSVSWVRPFLLMLSASALTGALLGLWFMLLQTSPLALFLMDGRSREAYTVGMRWLTSQEKKNAETQTQTQVQEQAAPPLSKVQTPTQPQGSKATSLQNNKEKNKSQGKSPSVQD